MTEAMCMKNLCLRQSVHGCFLFQGIYSVYDDYKTTKTNERIAANASVDQSMKNSTDEYICTNSSRELKMVKLPTIVCDVVVVICVKRGIRIILRRRMVMLTFVGHPE